MSGVGVGVAEVRNLSEQAYDRIRHDILYGELFPDEKLQIDAISERYGIGAVPVREALNRLSSEGLVERKSHRGFFVATISMADLEELVKTRIWLETLALTHSMQNVDEAWEEALVVSYHRLARTHRLLPADAGREISEEWEVRHKAFHLLLLDRCGSSWLLGFCSTLMDQAVRYRNLSMNTNPSRLRREGAAAEHQAILDAVLEHDTSRACQLLAEHYRTTLEGLRPVILGQSGSNPAPVRAGGDSLG
ncbi:GntR family transcriptional regulator [Mesorhizobium sp. ZC-5]|uniref:GntR family transcriptional regulator n=1 Tax=Mesorhizobium sp. ZC-5 TaxID=2986066 RepID=UPI0021E88CAD|nr:GntR family transcriptional regulator [Mesorhizobium sp. ZC-5]MCV3240245.1 GntR family transcriptional regulator [Mesorhizobium sp. ZC-5]